MRVSRHRSPTSPFAGFSRTSMCSIPLMISEAFAMLVIAAQIAALDPLMVTCASTIMVFLCQWLISVPAMIDDSNIPRFKQRLEIRYDHRPALRHGSDELGVRPFNRMGERELRGRPRGLNLVDATGVALCLELGLPFI